MEPPAQSIAEHPTSSVLLIRFFGAAAFFIGVPYLVQGVFTLAALLAGRYRAAMATFKMSIIIFDCFIGVAALVLGLGLIFLKEWARKLWLAFLILLLLIHFFMSVLQKFIGFDLGGLYFWIAVIVFFTFLSFWYLTRSAVKAQFH